MTFIQERSFFERLGIINSVDEILINYLMESGHITGYRKATREEDINKAIDFFLSGKSMNDVPVQWKVRCNGRFDIPVSRSQPFYGYDSELTKDGRDYRGLLVSMATDHYYVAVKDGDRKFCEIYSVNTELLRRLVVQLEQEWEAVDRFDTGFHRKSSVNIDKNKRFSGRFAIKLYGSETGEVWWKKNRNENFAKINFYFPQAIKEWSIAIPDEIGLEIKRLTGD